MSVRAFITFLEGHRGGIQCLRTEHGGQAVRVRNWRVVTE